MLKSLYRKHLLPLTQTGPQAQGKRVKALVTLAFVLFVLYVAFYLGYYIYVETYIWQCLGLGETLRPIARKQCYVPSTSRTDLIAMPSVSSLIPYTSKPKVGMLMIYDDGGGNWDDALIQRVIRNREKYCAKHGCTVIVGNDFIDKSRPSAWSKLTAVNHYLHQYDYIFYVDVDVVIMNMDIPPTAFISLAPTHDFIMTEDWNGVNSGNWLVKNTPFSHWFLMTAWNQTQLIGKKSVDGKAHPFEYEQRAFHFLLNTKIWQTRKLPKYRGDSAELATHFFLLPQCAMNSYIMNIVNAKGNREESHFVKDDFLVHFAGKKRKIKTDLMRYFLDEAE